MRRKKAKFVLGLKFINKKALTKAAIYLIILAFFVFYQTYFSKYTTIIFAATPLPSPPTVTDSPDPIKLGETITFTCQNCYDPDGHSYNFLVCKDSACTNCNYGVVTNCWANKTASNSAPQNITATYVTAVTGTQNYWGRMCDLNGICSSITAQQTFTVDGTAPTYSDNSTNSTLAGTAIEFRLRWTDNVGLSRAITSLWNGSSWINATSWCVLSGTTSWCNQTFVVNSTPQQLWWKQYANDTANNWNVSINFSLVTIVCKSNGETCLEGTECCSGYCKADYDGIGKWCCNQSYCAHDGTCYASGTISGNYYCDNGVWKIGTFYGENITGKNIGCYEVPYLIQNPDGSVRTVKVKICVWK
jgi:hypothetical protein